MEKHIYLSLVPEALVVSMLPPCEFGTYLATGTQKRAKEEAIYFDVDGAGLPPELNLDPVLERCVPHADGRPKHSVYASIYRVLERVPLSALGSLWLTTPDGRVLELARVAEPPADFAASYFLYKELAPVHPLIASNLNPVEFAKVITDPSRPVSLPKICFATMDLGGMSTDPVSGDASALPYANIHHLRDCFQELREDDKCSKTVDRIHSRHVHYRCITHGFFVGAGSDLLFYPFPSAKELEEKHHQWWRSATLC